MGTGPGFSKRGTAHDRLSCSWCSRAGTRAGKGQVIRQSDVTIHPQGMHVTAMSGPPPLYGQISAF